MSQELYPFYTFGLQHFLVLLASAIIGYVLIAWARRQSLEVQQRTGVILGWTVFISLAGTILPRLVTGNFDKELDIPLHLCHVSALLIPILMIHRKQWLFNILYFWVFAGTLPAILTPDLKDFGFPHWLFFRYWYLHVGLVWCILYAMFIYKLRPSWKALLQSFIALQIYAMFVGFVNWLINTNYVYLCRKPASATPLDALGDHPWYILVADGMMATVFILALMPFWFKRRPQLA